MKRSIIAGKVRLYAFVLPSRKWKVVRSTAGVMFYRDELSGAQCHRRVIRGGPSGVGFALDTGKVIAAPEEFEFTVAERVATASRLKQFLRDGKV